MSEWHDVIIEDMRVRTPGNSRRAWWAEHKHAEQQRGAVRLALAGLEKLRGKAKGVHIVRFAPRPLDPQNLPGALKHVIDGCADALSPVRVVDRRGVERGDDSPRGGIEYSWEQVQTPKRHAIKIQVVVP